MLGAEVQERVRDARVEVREAEAVEVRDPDPLLHRRLHQLDGLRAAARGSHELRTSRESLREALMQGHLS